MYKLILVDGGRESEERVTISSRQKNSHDFVQNEDRRSGGMAVENVFSKRPCLFASIRERILGIYRDAGSLLDGRRG